MRRADEVDESFLRFVDAFSPTLMRAAFLLLRNLHDAEDVLQVTFLRTLRRWERAESAPEAYSRVVLINICRERWRHASRHPEDATEPEQLVVRALPPSFSELIEHRDELDRALRTLPIEQREVLVCRYLLDLSVVDAAVTLGLAEGTVKSASSRGLHQLRTLLTHNDEEVPVVDRYR